MARHILVIEEDRTLLELYRQLLTDEGYQTTLSKTTFEKATDVERVLPDLVLLGLTISRRRDDLTLLEELRSYPPTSALPVLLCTAVREWVEEFRQRGFSVLSMPFELDELLAVIEKILTPV